MTQYPVGVDAEGRWAVPAEKLAENERLRGLGLSRQRLAEARRTFPWQEIDAACVMNRRRYLLTIKSGPNCINQTMAERIADAILKYHNVWLTKSREADTALRGIDVVIGITYGTGKTTSKKEVQILFKLLGEVFEEVADKPGVLTDRATGTVRVYRVVGQDFWAFVGNPDRPKKAAFVFLEVLLAVSKGITKGFRGKGFGNQIRLKLAQLSLAFAELMASFEVDLPDWMQREMTEDEVFWFSAALGAFYDQPPPRTS